MNNDRIVVGKMLRKIRFKHLFRERDEGNITYYDFKDRTFQYVNYIRWKIGHPPLTDHQLEEGWSLLVVDAWTYREAYRNMLRLIYGDW